MFIVSQKGFQCIKPFASYIHFPLTEFSSRNFSLCFIFRQSNELNDSNKNHIAEPWKENKDHTWVGPPDPVSNLRLKVFPSSENMTKQEMYFYAKSKEVQEWNQHYWELHNKDFVQSRKSYIEQLSKVKNLGPEDNLTTQEMADFYREFLNKNYKKHTSYNWQWYKKNFELLYLSAVAHLSRLQRTLKKDVS